MNDYKPSSHLVGSEPPSTESIDRLVMAICAAALVVAVIVGWTSTEPASASCAAPVTNQK